MARHCRRYKRVRMRGNGIVRRCAKYSGGGRARSRGGYRKRRRGGYRRGHRPFNKGRRCIQKGVNKRGIVTCRSYGGAGKKRRGPAMALPSMRQFMHNVSSRREAAAEAGSNVPSWMAL